MKPGQLVCDGCGKGYWPTQAWIHEKCASITASITASIWGSNDRENQHRNSGEVGVEHVQGSGEEVAQVVAWGSQGVQRGLRSHVKKPMDVPAPASGKDQQAYVEDDRMERGLDRGRRPVKQRWTREAYNAFQRAYLPVWRAVKAGKACWWPKTT